MKAVRNLLYLFFAMTFIANMAPFFYSFGLPLRQRYTEAFRYLGLLFLLVAAYKASVNGPPIPKTNLYGMKLKLMGFAIICLMIYGLIGRNFFRAVETEMAVFLTLFAFLVLGRYDQVWRDLEKPLLVYFWIGLVLVLIGLGRSGTVAWQEAIGFTVTERVGERLTRETNTLAYDIRYVLKFWPVLFALSYFQRRWNLMGLGTVICVLALQVASFKFRSMVAYGLLQVLMVIVVVPVLQKKVKLGTALSVLLGLGIGYLAVSGTSDYRELMLRFAAGQRWEGRLREVRAMLGELNVAEYLVGRGLGGHYHSPPRWGAGRRTLKGRYVTGAVHMGVFWLLLRGGLILIFVFGSFVYPMLLKKPPGWYENRYNVVAMAVLPVSILFVFMVPFPTHLAYLGAVAIGLGCARMGTPVTWEYLEYEEPYDTYAY